MSNEEILEEIYHEIHKLGMFHEFCEIVETIQKKDIKKSHNEIVQFIYHDMIQNGKIKSF
jgi:hypothetical protein